MKRIIRYEARYWVHPEGADVSSYATWQEANDYSALHYGMAARGVGVYVRCDHGNGLPDGMLDHIADVETEADAARLVGYLTAIAGLNSPEPADDDDAEEIALTTCCIWEELLTQSKRGYGLIPDNAGEQTARKISEAFETHGCAEMRSTAYALAPLCHEVHKAFGGIEGAETAGFGSYDWEFVPAFIMALDWSGVTRSIPRPKRPPVADIMATMRANAEADKAARLAKAFPDAAPVVRPWLAEKEAEQAAAPCMTRDEVQAFDDSEAMLIDAMEALRAEIAAGNPCPDDRAVWSAFDAFKAERA